MIDELPDLPGRAILVMKSTVPVGTGVKVRHGLDDRGLVNVGYVSNPEFLAEGSAVRDFMHPDRIAVGAFEEEDGEAVAGALRGARRADRAQRRQLGGDDQAGGERVPDDADLVHQRDRERLRGDRGGRREGRRGRRPRQAARPALPAGGDRLRRLVLPEGLARAEAARVELRLPLPAALVGDRGERAAEAARDRQADAPPRLAAGQEGRPARPRVQAEHGRHARGAVDRAREPPDRRGRRGARLGPGRRRRRPAARRPRSSTRSRRRCAAPTRR